MTAATWGAAPWLPFFCAEPPAIMLRDSLMRFSVFGLGRDVEREKPLGGLRTAKMLWPATPSRPGQGFDQHVDALCHSAPYTKQGRSRAVFDIGPVLLMAS